MAKANLRFHEGWYDSQFLDRPQITVTDLGRPVGQFYMGTTSVTIYMRFTVNCWLAVPRGNPGSVEYSNVGSMREEAFRVLNEYRHTITDLEMVLPEDEGRALHEIDQVPRVLRYELVSFAVDTHL